MTYQQVFKRMARVREAPGGRGTNGDKGLGDYVANEVKLALRGASRKTRDCLEPCLNHLRDAVELACPASALMARDGLLKSSYGVMLEPGGVFIAAANRSHALTSRGIRPPDADELPDLSGCSPAAIWSVISMFIDDVAATWATTSATSRPGPHGTALLTALLGRMGPPICASCATGPADSATREHGLQ
jgi:hypothetical protein